MKTPSQDGTRAQDVEALLREGAWVRRLALGLLGDEAGADDLSQEVLVVALGSAPALEGPRLRGWLGAVARRMATRVRERESARRLAERRAARSETVEDNARAHLELHQRLVAAIDTLEAPYRAALVMRYLEGLPPRAIAVRLDIPATAARKRVSRGLALLRERLDEEYGGQRKAWLAALVALVPDAGRAARGGPAGLPLSGALSSKVALGALALGLGVGGWLLLGALREGGALEPGAKPAVQPLGNQAGGHGSLPAPEVAPDTAEQRSVAAPAGTGPVLRVRVVDEAGAEAAAARAAWIDAAGVAHALELDADSTAVLPGGAEGGRFFASRPGYGLASARASSGDVVIRLRAVCEIRGRLLEDGFAPERSVQLMWVTLDSDLELPSEELTALEQLGVLRRPADPRTRADGSFVLTGLREGESGMLVMPTTHQLITVDGVPKSGDRDRLRVGASDGFRELETVRLPTIAGRLVWADDGAPYVGEIWVSHRHRERASDLLSSARTDADGRFEIGLPVSERALFGPPAARARFLRDGAVRFGLFSGAAGAFEQRVELAGATLPIDLGSVTVPRAPVANLRIVDSEGRPIAGAALASSSASTRSAADGSASLPHAAGDVLLILAPGHALASLTAPPFSEVPLEVTLAPGTTLVVRSSAPEVRGGAEPAIELAWDETPFEGGAGELRGRLQAFPMSIHRAFHRTAIVGAGWNHEATGTPGHIAFERPSDGPLVVPGLVAGASLRLRLTDALQGTLVERRVQLPPSGGLHEVELALDPEELAHLAVRLVDARGEPVPRSSLFVRAPGCGKRFECTRGALDLAPLAPGTYTLTANAPGFLPLTIETFEFVPGAPPLELELAPAHSLAVEYRDVLGQRLAPRSVRLCAEDGWNVVERQPSLGRTLFPAVPDGPLELELVVGTRTWTRAVGAGASEVEVVLPAHGRLAIRVDPQPELRGEDGDVRVRVRDSETGDVLELETFFTPASRGVPTLETELLPGIYRLEVDLVEPLGEEEQVTRPLERREVEIEAGVLTTTRVVP